MYSGIEFHIEVPEKNQLEQSYSCLGNNSYVSVKLFTPKVVGCHSFELRCMVTKKLAEKSSSAVSATVISNHLNTCEYPEHELLCFFCLDCIPGGSYLLFNKSSLLTVNY